MQQDLNLEKVNLSAIKAIGHDGITLKVLIETDSGYRVETLPAPMQAFLGLQQLARFATLTQATISGAASRKQLLDEIKMIPVVSSNIAAIGYSDVCRVLQVDFLSGNRYRYFNVPSQIFDGFVQTSSKGRYLNSVIKTEYDFDYSQVKSNIS